MTSPVTRPQSVFFPNVQELLDWTPENFPFYAFNRALVPLRPRPVLPADTPLLQDGNDFKGGYVANADLYPQGTDDSDTYNFSFWQYLDSFYYFTHHRISIPTAWWTNAAHVNGVIMMGNVIFEGGSGSDLTLMFQTYPDKCIDQLAALCQQLGFDGWFFNLEESATTAQIPMIEDFLSKLLAKLRTFNPHAMVIWYDALTPQGYVSYQNCLNSTNNPFFMKCNGIFPNYWWTPQDGLLQTSVTTARGDGRSPRDVYSGVDVYGRGTYYQAGQASADAIGVAVQAGTSGGVFAPGYTFENAQGTGLAHHAAFEQADRQYWIGDGAGSGAGSSHCIAAYITARAQPVGLPFATNFDRGRGTQFAVRGQQVSTSQWSNLSLQGAQPTYQFKVTGGSSSAFKLSFSTDRSFDGGASLLVDGSTAAPGDTATYQLFDFHTPLSGEIGMQVIFQPLTAGQAHPAVQVQLVFSDGSQFTSAATPQGGATGWYTVTANTSVGSGKTLSQCNLVLGPSTGSAAGAGYGLVIGELSLWMGQSPATPAPVTNLRGSALNNNLPDSEGILLSWDYPTGGARFFDVYQVDGVNNTFLMRACALSAWIDNAMITGGSATFGVVAVSPGLVPQPFETMATVSVPIDSTNYDDRPMSGMLGQPRITGLDVYFGNVLNGFSLQGNMALNGQNVAVPFPLHGGKDAASDQVQLDAGDYITGVEGYTGTWFGWNCVLQLTLKTKQGKTYGPFGGMQFATTKTPFSYTAPAGQELWAFNGSRENVPLAGGTRTNIIQSLNVSWRPVKGS